MVSLSFCPSFADRIYLKKGGVLLGKLLSIDEIYYKFKKRSGQIVDVPKYTVRRVTFSHGKKERGHGRFFMRLLLGTGVSGYNVTLQTQARDPSNPISERVVEAPEPHLRVDIEAGWMVVDAHLALVSGIEHTHSNLFNKQEALKIVYPFYLHTHSNLLNKQEASYFYQSLTAGLIYYLPVSTSYLNGTHLGVQARLPIGGSFRFDSEALGRIDLPLERNGIGFGVSIATREWCSSVPFCWGLALTYSRDSFVSQQRIVSTSPPIPPIVGGLPNVSNTSLSRAVVRTQKEIEYLGITLRFSYE